MKKRLLVLMVALCTSLSVLAGCGTNSTTDTPKSTPAVATAEATTPEATAPAEKTVVKMTKWGDNTDVTKDADYQLAEKFNKTNTKNIEIKLDIIPGDGYGTKLTTSFASGDGYDAFLSGEGDFYKWVAQGVNQPIDEFIAKDTTFNKDEVAKAIFDMGNINSKQYYLISSTNPLVLYYNTKMFDDAGLAHPDENTAWDTIFADAKKLTDLNKKVYGFNATTWSYAFDTYLESNGGVICDDKATTADGFLNSPATVALVDKYFNMAKDGPDRVSPTSANLDELGGPEAMMSNNKLGMFISGYWSCYTLTEAKATYATAVIPKGADGRRVSWICAAGYTMTKTAKNPEATYYAMQALTNKDAQQYFADTSPRVLPTIDSILQGKIATMPASDKAVIDVIKYGVQPVGLRGAKGGTIMTEFDKAVQKIVQGQGTTKAALDEAVAAIAAAK